jgi:hypothetical protein
MVLKTKPLLKISNWPVSQEKFEIKDNFAMSLTPMQIKVSELAIRGQSAFRSTR